ncbi:transporter substrate-binding domain-containing protein [Pseudomonas siliginis]|uniref:ATP-binding protein n=1 Tax=Pseudomonas siliginis TaxID=2842346 RepID=UPI002091FADE|nr:transporter substrate-binding domain-containing protein [Pseudomonas siliginis]UST72268.1 transporter substrate-binding domain-containing protein [Pseudomonas siliginis]
MFFILQRCLICFTCVLCVLYLTFIQPVQASPSLEDSAELQLIDRSSLEVETVELSSEDWKWVRNKRELVLGVASPNFFPVEIISNGSYYEGVTADVLGIIGKLLHIDVRVVRFKDRSTALNALELGLIDIVGSANDYELATSRVQLTQKYIDDQPVLYVRKAEVRAIPSRLNGMHIAMADDYLPLERLKKLYPSAQFVTYASREKALAALAFGDADIYLGDMISTNYHVNLNYFNYVRMHAALDIPTGGFAFAIRSDADRLDKVLNTALKLVREEHSEAILKRWSGGGASIVSSKMELSPSEQRWISRHPVVRYIVTRDTAPLSYFDAEGRFSGVSADLLKAISLRTGLVFTPVLAEELNDHVDLIEKGKADLASLVPTFGREMVIRFTRPQLFTSYAIITLNAPGQPVSMEDLKHKRIALPLKHALRELLKPASDFNFVEAATMLDAMDMVVKGDADATVSFLPVAQYYTMTLYENNLKVSNVIEDIPASLAFAVRKGDTELASILDKALLHISPDEIDIFQNRWRPKVDVSNVSWRDYRGLIYKVGGAAFAFILLSFAWNFYIRSQYKLRQQAESALNDQLNFMNALINGTPHPIYVRDRAGRMVMCNSNYLAALGATDNAVIGKSALEGFKINRQEALLFHDDYMSVMEKGEPLEVDRELHLPGRLINIYHWIHPYRDSHGVVKGVICGWIDISDRRVLMEELRTALDVADQSSRAKTVFLATMSHEIRTPMSAVIGMLELALKHADQGRFDRPAIEIAYDSARGLLELIGDILDVVRIESGHISLSPKRANLRELVESVARVFDGLARQKALTLSLHIDSNVNCDVLVDPMRFKQILSNLVGNAIKFTDTGEVKVTIDGNPIDGERLSVRLAVEDTGIGISAEELNKLFQPFVQANHGRTSRGGTGLGLAICKSLCELMGGEVSARSVLDKGTCVSLVIPFSVLPAIPNVVQVPEEMSEKEHPPMNILVIDDQPANRLLLTQQLAYYGQSVRSAKNGEEGLNLWREGNVDLIFTDCNMPVMNGYEMVRAIRREESLNAWKRCMIIGFTANAQPDEKRKCHEVGMDDCLFKPVSLSALAKVLTIVAGVQGLAEPKFGGGTTSFAGGQSIEAILHDLTGGDSAMTQALIAEARNSYTRDLSELKVQLQDFAPDSLLSLVHRIRGAARILQVNEIILACDHIERLCAELPIDQVAVLAQAEVVEAELERLIAKVGALGG